MRLRIATLNAWAFPPPLAERLDERMEALAQRIPSLGADVLALQEVWADGARSRLVAAGAAAGLEHVWVSDGHFLGGGLVLLSRIPFAEARFESYGLNGVPHRPAHPDYYGGKGFLLASVETAVGPVCLVNTHMHARYGSDVDHQYSGHRTAQLVQLAAALAPVREAVVLAGDFNFEERSEEYRAFVGLTHVRDAAAAVGRREPTVSRANPYRKGRRSPDNRIDFVFARDGLAHAVRPTAARRVFDEVLERDGERFAVSDHAGVLAERRRRLHRRRAGLGLGASALAVAALRAPPMTRRGFLRTSLQGTALVALGGTLSSGLVAELYGPGELEGFGEARSALKRLASGARSAEAVPST